MSHPRDIVDAERVVAALSVDAKSEGADILKLEVASHRTLRTWTPRVARRYLLPTRTTYAPRGLRRWQESVEWARRRLTRQNLGARWLLRRNRRTLSPVLALCIALSSAALGWYTTTLVPAGASYLAGSFAPVYLIAALALWGVFSIVQLRHDATLTTRWLKLHILAQSALAFGGMLTSSLVDGAIAPFSAWSALSVVVLLFLVASKLPLLHQERKRELARAKQRVQLSWVEAEEDASPHHAAMNAFDERLAQPEGDFKAAGDASAPVAGATPSFNDESLIPESIEVPLWERR